MTSPPLPEPWESLPPDDYGVWLVEFSRRVWNAPGESGSPEDVPAASAGEASFATGEQLAREGEGAESRASERLAQLIWAERHFRAEPMVSEGGRTVEVLEPGRWNAGAGPDFLKAELRIDGRAVRGDVEIHVEASGWRAHRHADDHAYNDVVLHAFLDNDDGAKFDAAQNNRAIERLCMRPFLVPDFDTLRETLQPDENAPGDFPESDLGTCHRAVLALDQRALERFLDLAARERMEGKIGRLASVGGDDLDQAIYQALATYLGQGATKPLFFLLSKRAPLADLRLVTRSVAKPDRVPALQAIFLKVAGLVPDEEERREAEFDPSALAYLLEIDRWWDALGGYFSDRLMPPTRRWFGGSRPVNFGTRLLAGFARLASRWIDAADGSLADSLVRLYPPNATGVAMEKKRRKALIDSLAEGLEVDAPLDWWATRYTFAAKPSAKTMKLIGPSRSKLMAFNALLPASILAARRRGLPEQEALCWRLYADWPKLQENAVARYMAWKLFAGHPRAKDVIVGEARVQSLFQIHADCCGSDSPSGGGCGYFGAPREGR